MSAERIWCQEIRQMIGPTCPACCDSCHSEWDDGYSHPNDTPLPDGRLAMACCVVSIALDGWLMTSATNSTKRETNALSGTMNEAK